MTKYRQQLYDHDVVPSAWEIVPMLDSGNRSPQDHPGIWYPDDEGMNDDARVFDILTYLL